MTEFWNSGPVAGRGAVPPLGCFAMVDVHEERGFLGRDGSVRVFGRSWKMPLVPKLGHRMMSELQGDSR